MRWTEWQRTIFQDIECLSIGIEPRILNDFFLFQNRYTDSAWNRLMHKWEIRFTKMHWFNHFSGDAKWTTLRALILHRRCRVIHFASLPFSIVSQPPMALIRLYLFTFYLLFRHNSTTHTIKNKYCTTVQMWVKLVGFVLI